MKPFLRSLLLSLMLGILEAMREVEAIEADRLDARWVMRMPSPLDHPERCWFWNGSSLAN
ncbi:MAG: hypothetical protein IPK70_08615 [Flavobacteriales bacterium]|jgi:hypothetical protein|nr:hypothetical protein [Flavobacteriales bacterium]